MVSKASFEIDNNIILPGTYTKNLSENSKEDKSIFLLEEKLKDVQNEGGTISDGWDNFKGLVGIGTSSEKCEEFINKYKNGEISFEEAMAEIDKFDAKQDSSLNLFSNIATSIAAIGAVAAVSVLTGGAALPVLATIGIGAATGAAVKTGFKLTDRATNEIKGDAGDVKTIAKDALSGAVTGGIAVATAGTSARTFKNGFSIGGHRLAGRAACMAKCTRTGLITGAVSGSSNYLIDTAFDDDKDFNIKDFAGTTAESTLVGGAVGCIMGGVNGTLRSNGILHTTDSNVVTNSACTASYKITNDRIRSIAS